MSSNDIHARVEKYTLSFIDNFLPCTVVLLKMLKESMVDADQPGTVDVAGKTMNDPIKAFENVSRKLEQLAKACNPKINGTSPKDEDMVNWVHEAILKARTSDTMANIITGCLDVCQSYERQMMKVDFGDLEKIAKVAALKVLKYYLFESKSNKFDSTTVPRGVFTTFTKSENGFIHCVFGELFSNLMSKVLQKEPEKSLKITLDEKVIDVSKFYTDVGIIKQSDGKIYETNCSKVIQYGYRRNFFFESNSQHCCKIEVESCYRNDYICQITSPNIESNMKEILIKLRERETDVEENIRTNISGFKDKIKNEINVVKKAYYLEVFEVMNKLLQELDNVIDTSGKEESDDKADKELIRSAVASGAKVTSISSNKVHNWKSIFN